MRNIHVRGTREERAAVAAIGGRLPPGWSVELRPKARDESLLTVRAPNGQHADLCVKSRKNLSPRDIPNLVRQGDGESKVLVVAPFLGPRSRQLLSELGVSYVDATGNVRLLLSELAVFLESSVQDRDPDRQPRPLRSLKGAAAGRVVRALCDFLPPYGVRTLAAISATPLGTVSRVVSLLEEELLLTRDDNKQVTAVDWAALIARWMRDYGVQTSNRVSAYLEPRGLSALAPKLVKLDRYAITGSMVGPSIAPARLAMIYVDDADQAAKTLELTPTDAGANVWLLEPYDEVVFDRTQAMAHGPPGHAVTVVAAAPSQVVADLMTSPGRGPQEAQALVEKMKGAENAWRHPTRS